MTNLFQTIANGNRGLNKTAELTAMAEKIASAIFTSIGGSLDNLEKEIAVLKAEIDAAADADKELLQTQLADKQLELDVIYSAVEDSKVSHEGMDRLIADYYDLQTADLSFLKVEMPADIAEDADDETKAAYNKAMTEWALKVDENEATIDKMIKSQQSKRSRAKGKAMTQDNYNTLMVGAISENLLRMASGKEKATSGHSGNTKPVEYDDATIEIYKTDKDKLSKEIRNIQSKKSIMKSKANFDDKSEAWLKLLSAEAMLKGLRGDSVSTTTVVKVVVPEYVEKLVEVKEFVEAEVATQDISKINIKDAKALLTEIIALMSTVEIPVKDAEEVPVDEADKEEINAENNAE